MNKEIISISREREKLLIEELRNKTDIESQRIIRYYDMPDLTRTPNNPIYLAIDRVLNIPRYKDFDIIETPEIVGVYETFDLFGFATDHPARSKSDTYYMNDEEILRTHTTIMWYHYLTREDIRAKLEKNGEIGVLSHGKVYRKDEIDRKHMNVFHQIDGLYICEKSKQNINKQVLVDILCELTVSLFGDKIEYRVLDDTFPYTDPSAQIEVKIKGEWLELLGSGVVKDEVLENLGIDSKKYSGWAFGPGIERIVMIKMRIPDIRLVWSNDERITSQWTSLDNIYEEVSKYPLTSRDISFLIDKNISLNSYYEIIQDIAGDLIEEVSMIDEYENEGKFGADKKSYTWRIVYRSLTRTLTTEEVNLIQEEIRSKTVERLGVTLR